MGCQNCRMRIRRSVVALVLATGCSSTRNQVERVAIVSTAVAATAPVGTTSHSSELSVPTGSAPTVPAATANVISPESGFTTLEGITAADGIGDPIFPLAGNGGYDAVNYDLTLAWDPATNTLAGSTVIDALATQNLATFDLDLRGFTVLSVNVNEAPATFKRNGQELRIRPAEIVPTGSNFRILVDYSGIPEPVADPDGSSSGWILTNDGATALGEPQGSPGWFPVNDHPSDKATFSFRVTVPNELNVVSNGLPRAPIVDGPLTTYTWIENRLMAPYLATVAIGHFTMTQTTTASGLPVINAIGPGLENPSRASLARIPEMVAWLSELFGPYPFDSVGAIVVDAPEVGYFLETQDRPTFTAVPFDAVMIHELAHQWIGNSVSVATWQEIWLNEGFAGYVEWLWAEHDGGATAQETFAATYDTHADSDSFWTQPPGPGTMTDAADLFGEPVYIRGAMTLHALRTRVGDAAFFEILRKWTTTHRDGNVTTAEFIDLAEAVSKMPLGDLFTAWLETPTRPAQ